MSDAGSEQQVVSSAEELRQEYGKFADDYNKITDDEVKTIDTYEKLLSMLADYLRDNRDEMLRQGGSVVVDTSCGTGQMLEMLAKMFDERKVQSDFQLQGIDITPEMVAIASKRLGPAADVYTGDMCQLDRLDSGSCACVISFFAIHHLAKKDLGPLFKEWARALCSQGMLTLGFWQGEGKMDYGGYSTMIGYNYTMELVKSCVETAGFNIVKTDHRNYEQMGHVAGYIVATKQ